jgi:hypothetical protein
VPGAEHHGLEAWAHLVALQLHQLGDSTCRVTTGGRVCCMPEDLGRTCCGVVASTSLRTAAAVPYLSRSSCVLCTALAGGVHFKCNPST